MLMLTEAVNTQPDYIALAMVLALAVIVVVMVIRKRMSNNRRAEATAVQPVTETEKPLAPGSAGQVKLHNVEPKTAAMLMAIVADKLKKPLNELRFISIEEVE